ncbi:hypothetical protein [Bradyrhizobium sp. McL0616]|uniref:hypothetical protein n=1 Tax=Bradyrhizobium sp. McL0616 TaxID=3415674 RepID=UPI003CEF22C0
MPADLADEFMRRLRAGETLRRFTSGDKRCGPALVTPQRFKKHRQLHPEWGVEAMRLAKINGKAADLLKSVNSAKRKKAQELCLKGLHPMSGDKLMAHKGRRVCLARWRHHAATPPVHSILPVFDQIKDSLRRGVSLGDICQGRPTGGGKIDRSRVLVRANVFYRYRELSPDLAGHGAITSAAASGTRRAEAPPWG